MAWYRCDIGGSGGGTSGTASGEIATFSIPNAIKSVIADIVATQEGSGTPSPSNVRPISGFDSIKITNAGKNLFDGSKVTTAYASNWGITWENDELTIEHKTSYTTGTPFCNLALPVGDYIFSYVGDRNSISLYKDGAYSIILNNGTTFSIEAGHTYRIVFSAPANTTKVFSNIMVAAGDTATDYEAYNCTNVEVQLGQTVYGGSLNVTTGELTITHGYIDSYDGESINEPWISSIDEYVSGEAPTTGAEVVYPLATPITVQLSATEVMAIAGVNNIWADSGEIEVEYSTISEGGATTIEPLMSTSVFKYVENFSGTDVRQLAYSYTASQAGKMVFAQGSYVNTNTGSNDGYLSIEVNGTEVYRQGLTTDTDTTLANLADIEVSASDVVEIYAGFAGNHSRCHFSIYTAVAFVA